MLHSRQQGAVQSHACRSAIEKLLHGRCQPFQLRFHGCNLPLTRRGRLLPLRDMIGSATTASQSHMPRGSAAKTMYIVLPDTTYISQRGALGFNN
jgi:hypothetical protein